MKRQGESSGHYNQAKRGRNDSTDRRFTLRFLVPNECAGAIIGRGGERIKAIHQKVNLD